MDSTFISAFLTILKITAIVVVAIVAWLTYKIWRLQEIYKHIPGPPKTSFYLGNSGYFAERRKAGEMMVETLNTLFEKYGDTYVLYFMHQAFIFTADQLSIKELLITGGHPKSDRATDPIRNLCGVRFLGRGLVTETDHEAWAKRRTVLNPAFNRQFLKTSLYIFNEIADALMEKLSTYADGKTYVDVSHNIHHATLDVIGKTAFGMDFDSINTQSPFPNAIDNVLKGFDETVSDPFFRMNPFSKRSLKAKVRESCHLLRDYGTDLVEERRRQIKSGAVVPDDVLTLVVKANESIPDFTMEEILDDFATIFIAGQETTANALCFALLELGRLPDVNKRLRQEIDDNVGSIPFIKYEEINQLECTQNVFKETLRLFPPAPLTFRETGYETEIGGYKVPKGTPVMMSMYVMGRSAKFTPKAAEFIPERFEQDSPLRPPVYAYFPFSLGPRNCIGQTFAMLEGKLLLAKFMQRFTFELHPDEEFVAEQRTTIRPRDGVRMKLTAR